MIQLDRTRPAARDLEWLPAHLRALRIGANVAVVAGVGISAVSLVAITGAAHLAALAAAGGIYAGHRGVQALIHSRVRRFARGLDLARLSDEEDGTLVHLRGVVRCDAPLSGFLHGTPGVYRRLLFKGAGTIVHEAAVDFDLVDESGELIRVEVAGAHLLAPDLERADYPAARFVDSPRATPSMAAALAALRASNGGSISATENLLRVGETVELLGCKSRTVDPRVEMRLERETPIRASIRSGRKLPLLITPVGRTPNTEI